MAPLTFDEARGQLQALVDAAQPGTYRREALEEVVDVASMVATAQEARAFVMAAYLRTHSTPDALGHVDQSVSEKHAAYLDAAMVLGRVLDDDLILPARPDDVPHVPTPHDAQQTADRQAGVQHNER